MPPDKAVMLAEKGELFRRAGEAIAGALDARCTELYEQATRFLLRQGVDQGAIPDLVRELVPCWTVVSCVVRCTPSSPTGSGLTKLLEGLPATVAEAVLADWDLQRTAQAIYRQVLRAQPAGVPSEDWAERAREMTPSCRLGDVRLTVLLSRPTRRRSSDTSRGYQSGVPQRGPDGSASVSVTHRSRGPVLGPSGARPKASPEPSSLRVVLGRCSPPKEAFEKMLQVLNPPHPGQLGA